MTKLIFLHGLNTYDDNDLHLGPLAVAPMHRHLETALKERGITLHPLLDLHSGSTEVLADRALRSIQALGFAANDRLVLVGHSVGGLVARELAARPELAGRVPLVMTFGTPHHGAFVAELGLQFAKSPGRRRALKSLGYDLGTRELTFTAFTRQSLQAFNLRRPQIPGVKYLSLLCQVERADVSWPLLWSYPFLHPKRLADAGSQSSDGFIWVKSQEFAECMGPFALDHFAALGFFFQLHPGRRRKSRREFGRLVDVIAEEIRRVT